VLIQLHEFDPSRRDGRTRGGVVYYDTELKFSPQRLQEIIIARYPHTAEMSLSAPEHTVAEELLLRVSVRRPMSCQQLSQDLLQLEEFVIAEGISLVCDVRSYVSSALLSWKRDCLD
jgi:hypothetical protein